MIQTDVERYADLHSFAREVNLPLLGTSSVEPVPQGANLSTLLRVLAPEDLAAVVDGLAETRQSLTLRSLLLAGFSDDPECFATGLAIAREWSRRGLRIAVIDLDFWNPTVVRPRPHPNEGLIDVLEYGCSVRRVAWEIVAEGLWLVGPGSHPPDTDRIVDHPDWDRAARGLAANVDVTFYIAPLLDRKGFVGRLSKRMDGVLLAASVGRIGRADLKDAFLELWGSDAPIIGCVGIEPTVRRPRPAEESPSSRAAEYEASAATVAAPPSPPPGIEERRYTRPAEIGGGPGESEPDSIARRGRTPSAAQPRPHAEDAEDLDLNAVLDREVRLGGRSYRAAQKRSRAGLIAGITVGALVAASIGVVLLRRPDLPSSQETMPAGTEQVLPPPDAGTQSPDASEPAPTAGSEAPSTAPQAGAGAPASTTPGGAPGTPDTDASDITPTAPTKDTPFRVHVASFKSEDKVKDLVRSLRLRGADAWYEPAPSPSGYYRVFVGHFATEAEARAHARWLLDNGWVDRAQAYPATQR